MFLGNFALENLDPAEVSAPQSTRQIRTIIQHLGSDHLGFLCCGLQGCRARGRLGRGRRGLHQAGRRAAEGAAETAVRQARSRAGGAARGRPLEAHEVSALQSARHIWTALQHDGTIHLGLWFVRPKKPLVVATSPARESRLCSSVRDAPTQYGLLSNHDGPNHLGLWCNAAP